MVRLEIVEEVIAKRDPAESPVDFGNINKTKYLAPIPVRELLLNPGWVQNEGY